MHIMPPKHCLLTMLTFNTNNPQSCGIVEVDNEGVVIKFQKSICPPGNQANGAVYVFDSSLLENFKRCLPALLILVPKLSPNS